MNPFLQTINETTTTTGKGNITLDGAVTQFKAFVNYRIVSHTGNEWEVGSGTLLDATTLSRDIVQSSSNGGYLIDFLAGTKDVVLTITDADPMAALDRANHTGSQAISTVTGLQMALDGKAASSHTHDISDTTGLQTALDGKAASSHTHAASDLNSGTVATARLGSGTADSTTFLRGDQTWATPSGGSTPSWHGVIYGAYGDCDPDVLLRAATMNGTVAATPTNIGSSVARIAYFRPPANITVNKIRYFGVGATTNIYRIAIYNADTLAQVLAETAFTTAASTWGAIGSSLNLTLTAGQLYFIAVAVNTTGTTAGILCASPTIGATTGVIDVLPKSWPGSLDIDSGYIKGAFARFNVLSGVLPDPAGTILAQNNWTGGFPAFWLDSSNA